MVAPGDEPGHGSAEERRDAIQVIPVHSRPVRTVLRQVSDSDREAVAAIGHVAHHRFCGLEGILRVGASVGALAVRPDRKREVFVCSPFLDPERAFAARLGARGCAEAVFAGCESVEPRAVDVAQAARILGLDIERETVRSVGSVFEAAGYRGVELPEHGDPSGPRVLEVGLDEEGNRHLPDDPDVLDSRPRGSRPVLVARLGQDLEHPEAAERMRRGIRLARRGERAPGIARPVSPGDPELHEVPVLVACAESERGRLLGVRDFGAGGLPGHRRGTVLLIEDARASKASDLACRERSIVDGERRDVDRPVLAVLVGEEEHRGIEGEAAVNGLRSARQDLLSVEPDLVEPSRVLHAHDQPVPRSGGDLGRRVACGADADRAVGPHEAIAVVRVRFVRLEEAVPDADRGHPEIEEEGVCVHVPAGRRRDPVGDAVVAAGPYAHAAVGRSGALDRRVRSHKDQVRPDVGSQRIGRVVEGPKAYRPRRRRGGLGNPSRAGPAEERHRGVVERLIAHLEGRQHARRILAVLIGEEEDRGLRRETAVEREAPDAAYARSIDVARDGSCDEVDDKPQAVPDAIGDGAPVLSRNPHSARRVHEPVPVARIRRIRLEERRPAAGRRAIFEEDIEDDGVGVEEPTASVRRETMRKAEERAARESRRHGLFASDGNRNERDLGLRRRMRGIRDEGLPSRGRGEIAFELPLRDGAAHPRRGHGEERKREADFAKIEHRGSVDVRGERACRRREFGDR